MAASPPHCRSSLKLPLHPQGPSRGRSQQFCVTGAASHIGNKFCQLGVDPTREFHVTPVLCRVWCCGSCECHRSHRDRSDDKTRSKPFLAAMAVAKSAQVLKGHLSRWL